MPDEARRKWSVGRVVKTAVGVYAAIVLIPLIAGIFMARADAERAAAIMAYFRDILLVVIFLAGILVATGVGILVVQLAALTGVVKVQAGALGAEVRGTFKAVRGAATFIAEAVASPAVRVLTFISGLFRFLGEITLLRRALRRDPDKTSQS